jgi:hypothetical protein
MVMKLKRALGCLLLATALSVDAHRILPHRPIYRGNVEIVDSRTFDRLYHRDPVTIERVECRGHHVHVRIRYRGGRRNHEFRLLSKHPVWWHRSFEPGQKIRRYPHPRQVLYLSHNANGETGRDDYTADLVFDLRLLQRWPGPIPLRLGLPGAKKGRWEFEVK